jgi:hypothetical protein
VTCLSVTDTALLSETSVLRWPEGLPDPCRRLVLVSHPEHLAGLSADDGTVVVATEWMTWRQAQRSGLPCLHLEAGADRWPEAAGDPTRFYLRHGEWMLDQGGSDLTLFRGLSLGRVLENDVVYFMIAYERAWHCLDRLAERLRPAEILLLDLQAEWHLFDADDKRRMAREIADRHGIPLADRLAPPARPLYAAEAYSGVSVPPSGLKEVLRNLYGHLVAFASGLGPARRRRPVMMLLNGIMLRTLMASDPRRGAGIALLAGHWPKTWAFLGECWKKGIRLVHLPRLPLDASDQARLREIAADLERLWAVPATGAEEGRRARVRKLIREGALADRAEKVKNLQALFDRVAFAQVLVGDANSGFAVALLQEAKRRGIPTDELPNGMLMSDQWTAVRGGGRLPPLLDRFLCWGEQNDAWGRLILDPKVDRTITGYPVIESLARQATPRRSERRRALVLPVYVDYHDVAALHANIATYLVDCIRMLSRQGFTEFRVKVHPGFAVKSYFETLLQSENLDCRVFKEGSLAEHVAWADVVVGPANSGSIVEVMALDRPYYGIAPVPTLMKDDYLTMFQVSENLTELEERVANNNEPDRQAILAEHCSLGRFPALAGRVWDALQNAETCVW